MATKETNIGVFDQFKPVKTKRASEEIYDQIRNLIISGELKPDDRLPSERNMMDMFQRSRPTIREALRMLERSGYIRTIAGSNGAIVLELNNKNVQQTMEDAMQVGNISLDEMSEYRKISEAAAVTWAAKRCDAEDISAIQDILTKMETYIEDYEKFIDMDPQFHASIAKAAKNEVSLSMNQTLSKLSRTFMKKKMSSIAFDDRKEMCTRVHEMHKAIYNAIKNHDAEEARKAMDFHLSAFEADLK